MSVLSNPKSVTGTWIVDPVHSSVEFHVKHMGLSTVKGQFEQFEGRIELPDDLTQARATGSVRATSLNTRDANRDAHLRSADFFEVDRYPELRFESTAVRIHDEDAAHINGQLTVRGVTREVVFEAIVHGIDTDPSGNDRLGLELVGQISRADFDMKFNQKLGSGNLLVGDRVKLLLDISAVRSD